MLTGIKFKCNPTDNQKRILSQWMGCARFIWNAKCEENAYLTQYARKYLPVGTYAPIDQQYSKYKTVLSPWLSDCPSQILRNSCVNWYNTYIKFMKGQCGKPKRKPKLDTGSIHVTKELFKFLVGDDGVTRLFIGSKKNNIGTLSVKFHARFNPPSSLYLKKVRGQYTVSFCYDDDVSGEGLSTNAEHLNHLRSSTVNYLNENVVGVDRGIVRPVQAGGVVYDFTQGQKKNKRSAEKYLKQLQRKLSRQKKGSKRRSKTRRRLSGYHGKIAAIREDFCHKTSRKLVESPQSIIVFEDLKTRNMTRSAKGDAQNHGKQVKQKSGLNKAILDKGWHQLEVFTKYKSFRAGKAFFKVNAHHTSQECAACGHIHPNNRVNQSDFLCVSCGHSDNADRNAAMVIKQRAIKLIKDTGTVLSDKGVLTLKTDTGRGVIRKPASQGKLQKTEKRQKRRKQQPLKTAA